MKLTRRLTATEFAAVLPLLNKISNERIAAARAALVDGKKRQEIADGYGWHRNTVTDAVDAVWRKVEAQRRSQEELRKAQGGEEIPPGWQKVELIAPAPLIEKFKAEIPTIPTTKRKAAKKK